MLSKNEVKYIQSLCHKKQRDVDNVFIAEGPKLADELLKSDFEIVKLYALASWMKGCSGYREKITEVTESELARISNLQSPNQVLLVVKQKGRLPEPELKDAITLVLDDIQDPGNVGTIVRTADWFGITQVVMSENTADLYNFKVVQASMGSICRIGAWYKNLPEWMKHVNVPVYGGVLSGKSIYDAGKVTQGLLVIGNEGKGISPGVVSYITDPLTIPKTGGAESLNAAIATGIILSHLMKI